MNQFDSVGGAQLDPVRSAQHDPVRGAQHDPGGGAQIDPGGGAKLYPILATWGPLFKPAQQFTYTCLYEFVEATNLYAHT